MKNVDTQEQAAEVAASRDIMETEGIQVLTEANVLLTNDSHHVNPPNCWDFDRFAHTMRVTL